MPPYAWNQPWLDANAQRAYPLADSATRVDVTGSFHLPDAFLVEFYLAVPASLEIEPQRFFLRYVTAAGGGYALTIAYDDGTNDPPAAATASFSKDAAAAGNMPFSVSGVGDFSDCTGKVVIGRTVDLDIGPVGRFEFRPSGGRLDPDCIRPQLRGVSRIVINGVSLYGDVIFQPGRNIQFRIVESSELSSRVLIDAVDTTGFDAPCDGQADLPPPIRTINGQIPDTGGNFPIRAGACVEVTTAPGQLDITDTCSQPCCGCPELDDLKIELRSLGQQTSTVAGRVDIIAMQQRWAEQMAANWVTIPRPGA